MLVELSEDRFKQLAFHYSFFPDKELGSGCFASVFEASEEYAIKIAKGRKNYTDPYIFFARYCLDNPQNPVLPKIKAIFTLKDNPSCCIVLAKKLKESKRVNSTEFEFIRTIMQVEGGDFLREMISDTYETIPQKKDVGVEFFAPFRFDTNLVPFYHEVGKVMPHLGTIYGDTLGGEDNFNWAWDLHPGNFMIDGNTLVVNDPIKPRSF